MKKLRSLKKHSPIHPGEILLHDFMEPLGLSQYRVAKDIDVSARRINEIVRGKRGISAQTALRLERYLKWPAQIWLNLQSRYEKELAQEEIATELKNIKPFHYKKAA